MLRSTLSLAFLLSLGGAVACGPSTYYVEDHEDYADEPPPPPRAEPIPSAPGPRFVWIPGYWYWTGRGYTWQAGYYAEPPATGHVWVRSGWVHHNGRYRYVPGRWARPGRVPRHHYVPDNYRPRQRPPPVR
jgi:hypothetical protein